MAATSVCFIFLPILFLIAQQLLFCIMSQTMARGHDFLSAKHGQMFFSRFGVCL